MAATVNARIFTGASEGTGADAETGIKFNKEDTQTGTTAISKPSSTGTNYSWKKSLGLRVTAGGGSTSLSNRKIRWASAPSTGLTGFFKDGGATYAQATGSDFTDDTTGNATAPSTYTALSTTMQTWDATSEAATDSDRNGNFVLVVLGVGSNYAGGAGSAISLPNLELQYDEA